MTLSKFRLCAMVALSFAAGSLLTTQWTRIQQVRADSNRVFELRVYHTLPGRLPALQARFRDNTLRIFKHHDMTSIGYWTPQDSPASENTLIYILAHDSRDAAKKHWAEFQAACIATTKAGAPNRYGLGIWGRQGPAMVGGFSPFLRGNGGAYFDPQIAHIVLSRFASTPASAVSSPLTVREAEILRLIAGGNGNAEIADALYIGLGTVKGHIRDILEKLSAADRTQAAVTALRRGYI